jgi:hypothetical protein
VYIIGPPKNAYVCADFARDVHNSAEAAGIRAAWVGIDIEGEAEGHAINAFQTTDRGLVFIDCTGVGLWDNEEDRTCWDRRAYVEVGQSYQVAYLDYYDQDHSKLEFLAFVVDPSDNPIRQSTNLGISLDEETWSILEEMGWVFVGYDPFNEEDRERVFQKYKERQEWLESHNIEEMLSEWTMEWIAENEARLYSWEIEPGHTNPISVRADVVQGSCFEPPIWSGAIEEQVLVIDEMPVVWQITWAEAGWRKPFIFRSGGELVSQGIVEDIHIHW